MNTIITELIRGTNLTEVVILIVLGYWMLTKMERRLESRISELVEKSATREDVRHIGEKITGITERVAWLEGRLELPVNSPDAGSMVKVKGISPEE